jgi:hypothetical protein
MADRVKIASQVTRTVNSQQLGDPALELRHERLRNADDFFPAISRQNQLCAPVVSLAGGTPHTIRNESDKDAVAFVVHAPGAPMEEFSRAAAALAADGNTSMEAVLAIAERYGIELLEPIPAAA